LERLPATLQLVVSTRSDPPLPLARLRAGGQLVELREADLRFTLEETANLLREATGLDLPAEVVAALAARTEGWVAGLQLAAISLSGHADPAGFVETFTGSHRFVLDYLTEGVLACQPEDLVQFLLETSVLDRLSGSLCDAVCGRTDSQQMLERIERASLFLVPAGQRTPLVALPPSVRRAAAGPTPAGQPRSCDRVASRRGRLVRAPRPR
jgi:LuxR family maltose regulon positive regulatory protein